MSLYTKLLKYQHTQTKSNLENFSTEILCDFLNRLTSEEIFHFLKKVIFLGLEASAYDKFVNNNEINNHISILWKTQYPITIEGTTKYPDLIGFINFRPAILIEVKITANFTHRAIENENEVTYISQLVDYGNWLNNKNKHAILILLSHSTQPPFDFLASIKKYGIINKNFITWNQIYQWLNDGFSVKKENFLSEEFKNFLLEQNMAIESPEWNDFSLMGLLVSGPGKRIDNLMQFIRTELKKKYQNHMNWGKESSYFNQGLYTVDYDQKIIWSWVIIDAAEYMHLSWGICFPSDVDAWGWLSVCPNLPKTPYLFFGLFSPETKTIQNYKNNINLAPKKWEWNQQIDQGVTDLIGIKYVTLNDIISFDKDTAKEIFHFIDLGFQEILDLLDHIV